MLSALWRAARHQFERGSKLEINRIRVSEQERKVARLSHGNLRNGVEEFHKVGLVILENAVEPRSIDHVLQRMLQDFNSYSQSSALRWNQGRNSGNIHRFLSISTKIYGQTASVLKSLRTSSVLSPISRSLHPTSPCLGLKGDKRSIAITTANISTFQCS
jgi:hypothetical protein